MTTRATDGWTRHDCIKGERVSSLSEQETQRPGSSVKILLFEQQHSVYWVAVCISLLTVLRGVHEVDLRMEACHVGKPRCLETYVVLIVFGLVFGDDVVCKLIPVHGAIRVGIDLHKQLAQLLPRARLSTEYRTNHLDKLRFT